jgi:hypothetical protein
MHELINEMARLLGRRITHQGVPCEVIDVLTEGPSLVLERLDHDDNVIQGDEHGDPRRRVPRTYTVPLRSEIHTELHPVVLELAEPEQAERLRRLAGLIAT